MYPNSFLVVQRSIRSVLVGEVFVSCTKWLWCECMTKCLPILIIRTFCMIVATKIQHQETVLYFKQTQRSLTVYFSGCSLLGWDTFTSPFTTPCTDLQCITRRHLSLTLHNELFSFGVNQGQNPTTQRLGEKKN